jgi:hypothetical protein
MRGERGLLEESLVAQVGLLGFVGLAFLVVYASA